EMADSPGALFQRLLDVMKRLREPGGCPWDREQTTSSLKPFLIEEAYEVLEAIESGHSAAVREELGDLLFQIVFHARVAEERGDFTMTDLIGQLIDKMVRRHPHVFGDASVGTASEALFSLVNVARLSALDADDALHGAIEKFRRRFTDMEAELAARGTSISAVAPDELEKSWEAAKAGERREKRS